MLTDSLNLLSRFIDPESIHKVAMCALQISKYSQSLNHQEVLGENLKWRNRIGLAAGFDKNGEFLNELSKLGFGALEVGTVTPRAQVGNLRPRIKKIPENKSILNWMGFPSIGMDEVYRNLRKYNGEASLGINIGKNKETSANNAILDYIDVAIKLREFADYNVVNVSSPNTKGLRSLENVGFLTELMQEYQKNNIKNVFIKISPEIDRDELKGIVSMAQDGDVAGIIGTNTTSNHSYERGGLSGIALKDKSYELINSICEIAPKRNFDLVACGGISSREDLNKYLDLNIDFFQIYSSFVYRGPKIIKELSL